MTQANERQFSAVELVLSWPRHSTTSVRKREGREGERDSCVVNSRALNQGYQAGIDERAGARAYHVQVYTYVVRYCHICHSLKRCCRLSNFDVHFGHCDVARL